MNPVDDLLVSWTPQFTAAEAMKQSQSTAQMVAQFRAGVTDTVTKYRDTVASIDSNSRLSDAAKQADKGEAALDAQRQLQVCESNLSILQAEIAADAELLLQPQPQSGNELVNARRQMEIRQALADLDAGQAQATYMEARRRSTPSMWKASTVLSRRGPEPAPRCASSPARRGFAGLHSVSNAEWALASRARSDAVQGMHRRRDARGACWQAAREARFACPVSVAVSGDDCGA